MSDDFENVVDLRPGISQGLKPMEAHEWGRELCTTMLLYKGLPQVAVDRLLEKIDDEKMAIVANSIMVAIERCYNVVSLNEADAKVYMQSLVEEIDDGR
jgi:hypothetical protein